VPSLTRASLTRASLTRASLTRASLTWGVRPDQLGRWLSGDKDIRGRWRWRSG